VFPLYKKGNIKPIFRMILPFSSGVRGRPSAITARRAKSKEKLPKSYDLGSFLAEKEHCSIPQNAYKFLIADVESR